MNIQPAEKVANYEQGSTLDVHHFFDSIQGEGPLVGIPATFIRLAGCNLECPLCDTDYTSIRTQMTPEDILLYLQKSNRKAGYLIVITGGEPFRQHIWPTVELLIENGYKVQIETNGTLWQTGDWYNESVIIVCSPKTPTINEKMKPYIHSYKYVMSADDIGEDGLPSHPLDNLVGSERDVARPHAGFKGSVYLQPVDVGDPHENRRHQLACANSCMEHGYTFCLQVHKLIDME
jgi:7-carboxy-7-deazaguanine synthase